MTYSIGERALGRYEILAQLPPHSLGALYRAIDRDPAGGNGERQLCVVDGKLLPSDEARASFARKVGLARGLRLPQLLWLFDVVAEGAQVVLVSEWAGLDRLRDRLEQRRTERTRWPLQLMEAWSALSEVALAVGALHKSAEVLGDLRAENVFVTPTGIKLFQRGEGLAADRRALIEVLERRGEDHALSPEVAQGSAPTVRSDIYSLGALAWELFFGAAPDPKSPPVAALERAGLRAALERALSSNPLDRPSNVEQFLRAVEPTLSEPLTPLPAGLELKPSQDQTPAVAPPTADDWHPKGEVTREIEVGEIENLLGAEARSAGGPGGVNSTRQIDVDEIEALLKKSREPAAEAALPPKQPSSETGNEQVTGTMPAPMLAAALQADAANFSSEATVVNPNSKPFAGTGAPPRWEDVQERAPAPVADGETKRRSPTLPLLAVVVLLAGMGYLVWSVGSGKLGARGGATPSAAPGMPAPFVPVAGDEQEHPARPSAPVETASIAPAVTTPAAKSSCPSGMRLGHGVCVDPEAQEVSPDAKKGISFIEAARFCGARGGRLCRETEWQAACAEGTWPLPSRPVGEWTVDGNEGPVVRGQSKTRCVGRTIPKSMAGSPNVSFRCCGDPH